MKRIIQYIRSKFHREHSAMFPGTYVVNVRLEHPQIMGDAVVKTRVAIDANSKEHARRRLQEELRLIVGQARKV